MPGAFETPPELPVGFCRDAFRVGRCDMDPSPGRHRRQQLLHGPTRVHDVLDDVVHAYHGEVAGIAPLPAFVGYVDADMAPLAQTRDHLLRKVDADSLATLLLRPVEKIPGTAAKIQKSVARPEIVKACETRSEEHTSELQSLMRNSNAVFC